MKKTLLKKYAELLVVTGVHIKKGQPALINASLEVAPFAHLLAKTLYKHGASHVTISWKDDEMTNLQYKHESIKTLCEIPEWSTAKMKYIVDKNTARISLVSSSPDELKGIDVKKITAVSKANGPTRSVFMEPYMSSRIQWCVAAVPGEKWAKKVFPELKKNQAIEALWEAIFKCVNIDENNDPIKVWEQKNKDVHAKCKVLNDYNFKELHYKSSNGTDFTVGLVQDHVWAGGAEAIASDSSYEFNPNIPTEEVFSMPDYRKADGVVVSTKPLSYQGTLIDDFAITFKDGKAISCKARVGQEMLEKMISIDEGACSLGEVALVPFHSPISQSGILFYTTLFDENAACHLAFGQSYSTNIKEGPSLDKQALIEKGANFSNIHVDFMIGSPDLEIVGVTYDNKKITIFKNGDWAI